MQQPDAGAIDLVADADGGQNIQAIVRYIADKYGLALNEWQPISYADDFRRLYGIPRTTWTELPNDPDIRQALRDGMFVGELHGRLDSHVRDIVGVDGWIYPGCYYDSLRDS